MWVIDADTGAVLDKTPATLLAEVEQERGIFELTLQRVWVANALFIFIRFALWLNGHKTLIPAKTGSDPT